MIFETIVTSCASDGVPHIAPFGVQWQEGRVLLMPYKPSTTLQNILQTGHAVLNLTDDVRVFAAAIAKKSGFDIPLVAAGPGMRLKHCLTHHALQLAEVEDDPVRPTLWLQVQDSQMHAPFRGFNRAQSAVVELAVLVSRLQRLPLEKITTEMAYLQIAIDKTAGPDEREAWQWLVDCVNNHIAQQTGMQQA